MLNSITFGCCWCFCVFLIAGNQSYNEIREAYYPASLRKPIQGLNYLLSCLIKPSTYFLMPICWRRCTHFSNEACWEKSNVIDIIFHNCDFFLILTTFSCNCNFILQSCKYFLVTDTKSHNGTFSQLQLYFLSLLVATLYFTIVTFLVIATFVLQLQI